MNTSGQDSGLDVLLRVSSLFFYSSTSKFESASIRPLLCHPDMLDHYHSFRYSFDGIEVHIAGASGIKNIAETVLLSLSLPTDTTWTAMAAYRNRFRCRCGHLDCQHTFLRSWVHGFVIHYRLIPQSFKKPWGLPYLQWTTIVTIVTMVQISSQCHATSKVWYMVWYLQYLANFWGVVMCAHVPKATKQWLRLDCIILKCGWKWTSRNWSGPIFFAS